MNVLILEDETLWCEVLKDQLNKEHCYKFCQNIDAALDLIYKQHFDFIITDFFLHKNETSLPLIQAAKKRSTPIFVFSSNESEEDIEMCYQSGCNFFLSKNNANKAIKKINQVLNSPKKREKIISILKNEYLTQNADFKAKLFNILSCEQPNCLFLSGPSGVGKTKLAKLIHEVNNQNKPFFHINLSEISPTLVESELFGHEKGAFTGAANQRQGIFEKVNGGTLFIDEIGTLTKTLQQKLLRVIEEKTFFRVGSTKQLKSDFKLITATCDDLETLIKNEEFRLDLFYRIKGAHVDIPPLNQRKEDIIMLTKKFIQNSPARICFSSEALNKLAQHEWKGNIRELKNFIENLIDREIGAVREEDINLTVNKMVKPFITPKVENFVDQHGLQSFINIIEKELVQNSLKKNGGRINEVCRQLKLSKTLLYRIKKDIESIPQTLNH